MVVYFYNFGKKENSTARPSAAIASPDCALKDPCSVLAPQVRCAWAERNILPTYAYIPKWGRYYFVRDISYSGSAVVFSLAVDVLATYKGLIGGSTQYVVRAASKKNEYLIDSLYPTKTRPEVYYNPAASAALNRWGTYILGVQGQGGTGASKGVTYYALTPAQMVTLQQWLNTNAAAAAMAGDFANALAVAVADVAEAFTRVTDYIKCCMWLPISYTGTPTDIIFGQYYVSGGSVVGVELDDPNIFYGAFAEFDLPAHPQAATLGAWLNSSPYSYHTITVVGLGTIPLSADLVTAGDKVTVQAELSMVDGSIVYDIYRNIQTDGRHIGRYYGGIGVNVPLSMMRSDVMGFVNNMIEAGSYIKGIQPAREIMGTVNGILSALGCANPQPQMLTAGGGGYHIGGNTINNILTTVCAELSDTDNTNHGSPLCERTQINTLSGYVQTQGAALSLPAFESERQQVLAYMDAGFFYE